MQEKTTIQNNLTNQQSKAPVLTQARQPSFFSPPIQPKLTINQPNDVFEQEADAMAVKVMKMDDGASAKDAFFKPTPLQPTTGLSQSDHPNNKPVHRVIAAQQLLEKDELKADSYPPQTIISRKEDLESHDWNQKERSVEKPSQSKEQHTRISSHPVNKPIFRKEEEEGIQKREKEMPLEKPMQLKEQDTKALLHPVSKILFRKEEEEGRDMERKEMAVEKPIQLKEADSPVPMHPVSKVVFRKMEDEEEKEFKSSGAINVSRKEMGEENDPAFIQRKNFDGDGKTEAPSLVTDVLKKTGQPLADSTRGFMENRFGYDFDKVRVHTDSLSARSAQSINALAYTSENNIVFNQGQYSPGTDSGKKLLAHELTHVIQQQQSPQLKKGSNPDLSKAGSQVIQRTGTEEVPLTSDLGNDVVFQQWINSGQALLSYRGQQWMIFQWTGGLSDRVMAVSIARIPATNTVNFTFSAPFRVTVNINEVAERYVAAYSGTTINLNYQFRFNGSARMFNRGIETSHSDTPGLIQKSITADPHVLNELDPFRLGEGGAERPFILSSAPPLREFSRVWSFSTQEAFNRFAAYHPDSNWACVVMPDGRFVAYAMTRETIHRFAGNVRRGAYQQSFASEFNGRVSTVFIHGQQLSTLEELGNLYFDDQDEAALGIGAPTGMSGEPNPECIVFDMGDQTFGRKPLSHQEALAIWQRLASMPITDVFNYEVQPGRRLVELNVHGRGSLHSLNRRYFNGRDSYYTFITDIRAQGNQPGVSPGTDQMYYMLTETDRPDINFSFLQSLQQNQVLATDLQEVVYQHVEDLGQRETIRMLRQSHDRLAQMATSRDVLNSFVIGFHALSEQERTDALSMLGMHRHPPGTLPFMVAQMENNLYDEIFETLSDVNQARRLILGLNPMVFDELQARAEETAAGIQQVIDVIQNRSVIAIRAEGDLGVQARNLAYRQSGFTRLRGDTYPHTGEVDASFPGPMSGNTASFGSIAEQLYANRIVRMTNEERVMRFLGITAAVLGTAALILLSGGAGTAVAGLFFAEGSAAFVATEIVVGGLTFTAMQEGVAQISGRGEFRADDIRGSVQRLGASAVANILTFGVFRGLNSVFGALGRTAVGGADAVAQSTTRAGVANAIRLTGLFSTTYFSSIIQARIRDGRFPDSRELLTLFYENALTLLVLEVGGRMVQPLTEDIGIWARGRRMGAANVESINNFTNDILRLQEDIASYIEQPTGRSITDLLARQQQMLARQRELVNQLQESARGTGDAEAVSNMARQELQHIEETISLIREVQFIAEVHMRPTGTDDNSFYYREGAAERIRSYYGANSVQGPDAQGVIRVRQGDRTITFRTEPAVGDQAGARAGAGGAGGVRGNVYDLGTAGGAETLRTRASGRPLSVSHLFRFLTSERVTDPANTSDITGATIQDTLQNRLHGSTLSWPPGQPYFEFTVPVPGRGTPVTLRITIKFAGFDSRGVNPEPVQAGPHGPDTGPATYRMVYNGGRIDATIDINPDLRVNPGQLSRSRDLELVVGHELDEIADIARQIYTAGTPANQAAVDTVLAREAAAVVFRPGSRARASSISSHDRASASQLYRHFLELSAVPGADTRFTSMLESMGLTGRSTSSEFSEFRQALELSGQTDPAFLQRVEIQWRLLTTQRVLASLPATQLLDGGQRVVTPELIDHLLNPHLTSLPDFPGNGIDGGHQTSNLEAVNTDPASPYYVVREGTITVSAGRYAHRYHQYYFKGPGLKADAPAPVRVEGGATANPQPGVHYDPAFWEPTNLPKSAVDDINGFLPEAEQAFASYFRTSVQGVVVSPVRGRRFNVVLNGTSYMGFYNYDGVNVGSLSLNSIFVDAASIP